MQAVGEKLAIARRLCGPRGRGPQAPETMADTLWDVARKQPSETRTRDATHAV